MTYGNESLEEKTWLKECDPGLIFRVLAEITGPESSGTPKFFFCSLKGIPV